MLVAALAPALASAHVGYVVGREEVASHSGRDFRFLFSSLVGLKNLGVVAGIVIVIAVLAPFLKKLTPVKDEVKRIESRLATYHTIIPWITRLSLGIALIGTGTSDSLISPILAGFHQYSAIQTLAGFLILAGFLLCFSVPGAIVLFLIAFFKTNYLIGNLDFLALAAVSVILSDGRPGLDDLLGLKFPKNFRKYKSAVPVIIRGGLGLAFIYLALYEKILNPHLSALVVSKYNLMSIIPVTPAMWIFSAGVVEFALGAMILLGFRVRLVSIIASIVVTLSFFYFKEDVTSHVTIFGALSILFITGAGSPSLDEKTETGSLQKQAAM